MAEDYSKKEEQLQQRLEKLKALERELKEKEKAEHALEEKMNRWVYLNDLAERIQAQKV